MIKTLDHKNVLRWSGEETYSADDVKLIVSLTDDYETTSIELEDGRVLVHCFSGCDVESILDAVGLTFDDLFPETHEHRKSEARPFPAPDVLRLIAKEALIVAATAKALTTRKLTEVEYNRSLEASALIQGALRASGVSFGAWK